MAFEKTTVESWETMQAMKQAIGASGLQKIFSCGQTQINRYCRNPGFTADSERNPLDRMRLLLREAEDAGAHEAVRAALDYIMEPLGLRVQPVIDVEPNKPTLHAEQLETLDAVNLVFCLMNKDNAHPSIVRLKVDLAHAEIEQDMTSYKRNWEKKS